MRLQAIQDDLARERDPFFAPLTDHELATLQEILNRLDDHLSADRQVTGAITVDHGR